MFRLRCSIVLVLIIVSSLSAGEQPNRLSSRFEIQHDLFLWSERQDTPSDLLMQTEELSRKKKSVGLAAIYSLVLPGLGEYYAEGFGSGKYFAIAEGVLWLTFATLDIQGNSLRDDARSFAVTHAGIIPVGKNDQFYVDIGNFQNTQEYNDKRLRERNPNRLYDAMGGYGWAWNSDAARAEFKETRIAGENVLNNRKFVVLGLVLNHIASAINAARSAISYNKESGDQMGELHFKADVMGGLANPHGVMVTVSKGF